MADLAQGTERVCSKVVQKIKLMNLTFKNRVISICASITIINLLSTCSPPRADWEKRNEALIEQHQLSAREIASLPPSQVKSNLGQASVKSQDSLKVELHPGVDASLSWGRGTMVSILKMDAGSEIPEETLTSDRFLFVLEGSIRQLISGNQVEMLSVKRADPDGTHSATPRTDFVFLEKGSKSSVAAGPAGATLLEVCSPLRLDYLKKAGVENLPSEMQDVAGSAPNIPANQVLDLYDLQLTRLADGAYSRLISGRNMQLSFISMDPLSTFPHHIHPEEQMMLVLRGACSEILLDGQQAMNPNSIVRIPGNLVHGANIGELGCDALDIFWPARPDYSEKEKAAVAAYRSVIPEDSRLELIVDGKKTEPALNFSEGPKWMNGKVYFSNMYFDQAWNADPKKSSTVELSPDGTYRNITSGKIQTNGLYPYKNGNLIVCDMMGHRIVEMTTKGQVVKVLADKYDGKPLDGPNDVVTDAKGGFYFTDPQFTMEAEKFQPGRAVYYVSPQGSVARITEPNEFAMPNGIVLSPDGKTLYINNCYDDESWYPVNSEKENFIWAYDVKPDGKVGNGRKFAKLFLTGNVLDRKGKSSSADGMAIDKQGNLYVATYYGVQIFNSKGEYIGMINLPSFPVSLCFGDADMKTLYIVSYSSVYKIRTNMEGFVNYL
jgi:gluconolactonase